MLVAEKVLLVLVISLTVKYFVIRDGARENMKIWQHIKLQQIVYGLLNFVGICIHHDQYSHEK